MPGVALQCCCVTIVVFLVHLSAPIVAGGAQSAQAQHLHAPAWLDGCQQRLVTGYEAREQQKVGLDTINGLSSQRHVDAVSLRPRVQHISSPPGSLGISSSSDDLRTAAPGGQQPGSNVGGISSTLLSGRLHLQLQGNGQLIPASVAATSETESNNRDIHSGNVFDARGRNLLAAGSGESEADSALHALEDSIDEVISNSRDVLTEAMPANSSSSSSRSNNSSGTTSSSNSTANVSSSNATSVALAAALLPLASSNMRQAASSPLIPAVAYYYKAVNGSEAMPLGMPVSLTPGLVLTRWVLSAWGVSNISAPAGAVDSAMQRVEQLINNFTRMSPGQVQLSASVNVTLAFTFRGVSSWTPAATRALQQAASDAAGGYDPTYIAVMLQPPDFGITTDTFLDSNPAPVNTVPADQQVVFYPVNSNIGGSNRYMHHRRLLQQSSPATAGDAAAAALNESTGTSKATNQSAWTPVWVSYQMLDPLNVTLLLRSLSLSCGGADLSRRAAGSGVDVTTAPCGQHTRQLLQQAGIDLDSDKFAQSMTRQPMVSVNIRLAVGVTPEQAASNTDSLVALWLAQPRNIAGAINMSGLPDPIGPDALIKWIVTPEIWRAQVPPTPLVTTGPVGLSPGAITGIVLGSAAFAAIIAGVVVYLIDKRRKQHAESDKTDALSSTSSRRHRRRRSAKPRYLLPVLPVHTEAAAAAAAAAAGGTSSSATSDDQAVVSDDAIADPDQIRPAMKELGDSVTSAARFELDDEEGQTTNLDDRSTNRAVGEAASSHVDTAPATRHCGIHPVVAARAALLAECQQREHSGASTGTDSLPSVERSPTPSSNHAFPGTLMAVYQVDDASASFNLHQSGSTDVTGTLQPGPCTPPQTLPTARVQHSPDHSLGVVSPKLNQASAIVEDFGTAQPTCCIGNSSKQSASMLCTSATNMVSDKVSKSPFVCSYNFTQLADAVPKLVTTGSVDSRQTGVKPGLDFDATQCSKGGSNPSGVGLRDVGSITVSVELDGNLQVLHLP